ncbi:hypothetical protein F4801DRAFT_539792 [Xylaria longipes]|nr:hypothetical protein F4801DRAFT_539792 [Xylaria longipes]
MGSQLTENFGWRTTFGFESLLILCATLAATFTLRKPNYSKTSLRSTWRNLDVPGTILLVTTDAILLIAVNLGGNELPWSHPVVITLLILVIPAVGLLCAVELYSANDAVIPLHCFNDHRIGSVIACGAIADFAYTQVISNLALYVETKLFETGSGFSDSALSLVFLGRPLGSACAGLVIKYARAYKILILAAVCANGLIYGGIGLRFIPIENTLFSPFLVMIGFILGILDSSLIFALLSLINTKDFGSFYALFKLTSEIFGDIGIDVSLALTQSLTRFRLAFEIGSTPHRDEIIKKALQSLDSIRQLPPHTRRIILNAFSSATETTFVLSALVIFLGVLAAWKIPELEAGGTVVLAPCPRTMRILNTRDRHNISRMISSVLTRACLSPAKVRRTRHHCQVSCRVHNSALLGKGMMIRNQSDLVLGFYLENTEGQFFSMESPS